MQERNLDLKRITVDPDVVVRKLDKDTVTRYQEATDLPPIDVFEVNVPAEGKTKAKLVYVLADGLHRLTAASQTRGRKEINARIHTGTLNDAKTFALLANLKHGRPLTGKERDEAIRRLAQLNPKWGYRELAKTFNCSHMTAKRALKPAKKRPADTVHVQQGAPVTVPTGPKAAKAPADVFNAILTVMTVIEDEQTRRNVETYATKAVAKEVQVRVGPRLVGFGAWTDRLGRELHPSANPPLKP